MVGEQVKKQSLSFYKVTGTDKESSYEAVAGAKFSIYRVADLADGKYVNVSDAELPQAIIDEVEASDNGAFKSKKMFTVMIKWIAPIFLIAILISSILNAFGIITM